LTLLLCFFLSIVALNAQKINKLVNHRIESQPGILIADSSSVKSRTWHSFRSFELDEASFKAVLNLKISELLSDNQYEMTGVFIESCDVSEGTPKDWSWHQSISQGLALQGQIVDTLPSLNPELVMIRALGPHCEALTQGEKESVVMVGFETAKKV